MQVNQHASNRPARIRSTKWRPDIGKYADYNEGEHRSRDEDRSDVSDRFITWRPSRAPIVSDKKAPRQRQRLA